MQEAKPDCLKGISPCLGVQGSRGSGGSFWGGVFVSSASHSDMKVELGAWECEGRSHASASP